MAGRDDLRKLIREWIEAPFPGLSNTWTMPVENRLDMELTGIKTPVGMKFRVRTSIEIQRIGSQIEEILTALQARAAFLPNESSRAFTSMSMSNRAAAARYGLTLDDVQQAVTSGIGGENIADHVKDGSATRSMFAIYRTIAITSTR